MPLMGSSPNASGKGALIGAGVAVLGCGWLVAIAYNRGVSMAPGWAFRAVMVVLGCSFIGAIIGVGIPVKENSTREKTTLSRKIGRALGRLTRRKPKEG